MTSMLERAVGGLLDLAFPAVCPGCGREGDVLCDLCRPALDARLRAPPGVPIGSMTDLPPPLLQLEWCAPFDGTVRRALHSLKYGSERRLARPLGEAIARRWSVAGAGGDLIVPVPVHPDRRRERGYDQAVLIAVVAAHRLGLPCTEALVRVRPTEAQYRLDRGERAGNVDDAFALARQGTGGRVASVAGRWVVLVDDVVTTGSTLASCGRALLAGGALAVSAVTVARER